jgi:hypothetical protein
MTSTNKDKFGIDLGKIQQNFKKYQTEVPKKPAEVFTGGTPNFNEKTGQAENYAPSGGYGKDTGIDRYGVTTGEKKAQQFKTNYSDDLKKYMTIGGNKTVNSDSSVANNIEQNAGNKEDMTTNIGNNNDIKYSNIGNDYSVNIGGIGDGFSNMQGAAAYTALNNNQYERSRSQLNGLSRSAQASENANALVGARDRSANLYNSMGYSQNYWRQKADAQQNFYLGDVFKVKAPEFKTPEAPVQPEDSTKEIYEDGLEQLQED